MSWARETKEKVEWVALSGCRNAISRIRARAAQDARYATSLRLGVLDLLYELWPPGRPVPLDEYHTVIAIDLDRIPTDLLGQLADRLVERAQWLADHSAASSAAEVVGGWLRSRSLELTAEMRWRQQAKALKGEYGQFVRAIICERRFEVA